MLTRSITHTRLWLVPASLVLVAALMWLGGCGGEDRTAEREEYEREQTEQAKAAGEAGGNAATEAAKEAEAAMDQATDEMPDMPEPAVE